MSLLDELTAELCAASDHLPLATLRHAVTQMNRANERLVHAIRLAATAPAEARAYTPSLARLGAATAHVETGAGLMMRAQDEVGAYLVAIGCHARPHAAAGLPVIAYSGESWWQRRVTALTGEPAAACDDPARTGSELLRRVLSAVRAGDRAALSAQLIGAGAGAGSSVSGRATGVLRSLAAEAFGREAGPDDVAALRARAGRVHDLVPNLPPGVVTALLRRACAAVDAGGHDAVDLAVGSAVLVARLCCSLGRDQALDG